MEREDAPSRDAALAATLRSLAVWLDEMRHFIAVSRSEWEHASVGQHLLAQRLHRHTLGLRRRVQSLSDRLDPKPRIDDTGEEG